MPPQGVTPIVDTRVHTNNMLKRSPEKRANGAFESQYTTGKKLADIQGGGVITCTSKNTGRALAAKYLDTSAKQNAVSMLQWESYATRLVKHPNVVECVDLIQEHNRVYILTELCDSDLYAATDLCDEIPENCARKLFLQMANSVAACHREGMSHRDIKFENFFVKYLNGAKPRDMAKPARVDNVQIKLGDFGFSCMSRTEDGNLLLAHERCGSDVYGAPEQVLKGMKCKDGYNPEKADIYSLGVCAFMITVGFPCWESNQNAADPYNVIWTAGEVGTFWTIIDHHTQNKCSDEFKDLFTRMCAVEPSERPTIQEVLEHPWVTGKGRVRKFVPSQNAVAPSLKAKVKKALLQQ